LTILIAFYRPKSDQDITDAKWKANLYVSFRLCLYSYISKRYFGFFTKLTLLTNVQLVIQYNP